MSARNGQSRVTVIELGICPLIQARTIKGNNEWAIDGNAGGMKSSFMELNFWDFSFKPQGKAGLKGC